MDGNTTLPALITRQGGALEKVVRDIDRYVDARFPLERRQQVALGRLVAARPSLNNETHVALLADALAFHGVDSAPLFGEVIDEFALDVVHLALDYLYEVGQRTRGAEQLQRLEEESDQDYQVRLGDWKDARWDGPRGIRAVCRLVANLHGNDYEVTSAERLDELVQQLGGLDAATMLDEYELADTLDRLRGED